RNLDQEMIGQGDRHQDQEFRESAADQAADQADDGQYEIEDDLDLDRPEEGLGVEEEQMLEQPARRQVPLRGIYQQGDVVERDQPRDPRDQKARQATGKE